jgi:hypothetical protein
VSGNDPDFQSPERFELERIISVDTIDGTVILSVQIAYNPWGDADIYDHIHAINGFHSLMIHAAENAFVARHKQYENIRQEIAELQLAKGTPDGKD